jgi:hypothetical protein
MTACGTSSTAVVSNLVRVVGSDTSGCRKMVEAANGFESAAKNNLHKNKLGGWVRTMT